jgi:hypothetical protein
MEARQEGRLKEHFGSRPTMHRQKTQIRRTNLLHYQAWRGECPGQMHDLRVIRSFRAMFLWPQAGIGLAIDATYDICRHSLDDMRRRTLAR